MLFFQNVHFNGLVLESFLYVSHIMEVIEI